MKKETVGCLKAVFELSQVTATERPEVPPTRDELLLVGATKKGLKELTRLGLVRDDLVNVVETLTNGNTRKVGRVAYKLTALGQETVNQLGFKAPK